MHSEYNRLFGLASGYRRKNSGTSSNAADELFGIPLYRSRRLSLAAAASQSTAVI
jgi:hypothetical protein